MVATEILVQGAEVKLTLAGDEDSAPVVAILEGVKGNQATAMLLAPWKGTPLDPGTLLDVGAVSDRYFYRSTAVVLSFFPPSRVLFELRGKVQASDRREYMRVSDEVRMRYSVLQPEEVPVARLRLQSRRRVILSRAPGTAELFRPSMDSELEYLARRLDDLEAKINRLLALAEDSVPQKQAGPEQKRLYQVSISGSGIRFQGDLGCRKADMLELLIDLPLDPPVEVAVITKVLSVEDNRDQLPGTDPYTIRGTFVVINERERDDIVRYTFQRQRTLLREQRSRGAAGAP